MRAGVCFPRRTGASPVLARFGGRSAFLLLLPLRFDSPDDALLSCTRRRRVGEKAKPPVTAWLAALLFVAPRLPR
jgi:hypothetical protein